MTRALLAAMLLCAGSALAQPQFPSMSPSMPMQGAGPAPRASDQGGHSGMAADMERMDQAMRNAPMTGDPDHDFVVMMIPHHQGAVDMAQAELRDGKDPDMRRLARAIIVDQQREIAQMRRWLQTHDHRR